MDRFILTLSAVNGDDFQGAIRDRSSIRFWLSKLDHEGSSWSVVEHIYNEDGIWVETKDLTDEIQQEYEHVG